MAPCRTIYLIAMKSPHGVNRGSAEPLERPPIVSRGAGKESPLLKIEERMHIRTYRPDDLESLRRMTVEAFDGVSIAQNMERRYGLIHEHDWRWHMARQIDADV